MQVKMSSTHNANNNKGGVTVAAEDQSNFKEERSGIGSYIWSFLTGSHKKCRSKISIKRKNKNNKTKEGKKQEGGLIPNSKKTHPEDDEDSDGGTFGIQKTEKLKCFVKPKPPTNRRRPTSSVVSSRLALSSGSYAEEEHSKSSQSLEEKNTLQEISEEEGEDKNDPSEKEILTIPLLLTTDKETHNIDSEKDMVQEEEVTKESQECEIPSSSHRNSPTPSSHDSLKIIDE
uniref:Uncharacterized protein n=1 Tax=Lepeophtheirus salmonis TaxID=72036 RepID=A0A0K2TTC8_LEPSM